MRVSAAGWFATRLGMLILALGLAGCGTAGPVIPPDLDTYEGLLNALVQRQVVVYDVYCASGRRSAMAHEALVESGFKYVFDFGSIENWQGAIVTPAAVEAAEDCACPEF